MKKSDLIETINIMGSNDLEVDSTILKFNELYHIYKWKNNDINLISEISNENYVGKPVSIIGNISSFSNPFPSSIDAYSLPGILYTISEFYSIWGNYNIQSRTGDVEKNEDFPIRNDEEIPVRITCINMTIKDEQGAEIKCLPISWDQLGKKLHAFISSNRKLIFHGTIVPVRPDNSPEYYFYLKEIGTNIDAHHLIKQKKSERNIFFEQLNEISASGKSVRKYIKDVLAHELGIKGLEHTKEFDRAIDFAILQSFSFGISSKGQYSNKLHSLVIGSPAMGKDFLIKIALILNPVSFETSSVKSKITSSGLIGWSRQEGKKIVCEPGYLPLASGGIICIPDFHEISRSTNEFSAILAKVMQSGVVIDSTRSKITYDAVTSIHIDMNRLSQVDQGKTYDTYSDLKIPKHILSRFDFICEIPFDENQQSEIVRARFDGGKTLKSIENTGQILDWQRKLKILVAGLTTMFPEVEIGEKENKLMFEKWENLLNSSEYSNFKSKGKQYSQRIFNSFEKIVKAISCSESAYYADPIHIEEAFDFLKYKIDFLNLFEEPEEEGQNSSEERVNLIESLNERQKIIMKHSSEEVLNSKDICDEINSETGKAVSLKTIERDLKELEEKFLISKIGHGQGWKILDVEMSED